MNRRLDLSTTTIALLKIITVCLVMAGSFMVLVGGASAYEAYSSQFWPTTSGEIIQSSVYTYTDVYDNRTYRSKIKYGYVVNQSENAEEYFTSERVGIDPFPPTDNRAIAEASLARYPKGENVDVYYNPNRPQKSMLEPSFSLSKLIYPGMGLLVLAVAFSLRAFSRHK
jgi:hypothetical protein